MTYTTVLRQLRGKVMILTLNRPGEANTLTKELLIEFQTALDDARNNSSVRAIVITGAGQNFSLGGDQSDFRHAIALPEDQAREYFRERARLLEGVVITLANMPKPTIAAVNGQAAGAGFSIALACDLRVVSHRTKFNFAYGALGLPTDGGMSWFLPQIVTISTARNLLLQQPTIRADYAQKLGIASYKVPIEELLEYSLELAVDLAATARYPILCAKQILNSFMGNESALSSHLALEHALFEQGLFEPEFSLALGAHQRGNFPDFLKSS